MIVLKEFNFVEVVLLVVLHGSVLLLVLIIIGGGFIGWLLLRGLHGHWWVLVIIKVGHKQLTDAESASSLNLRINGKWACILLVDFWFCWYNWLAIDVDCKSGVGDQRFQLVLGVIWYMCGRIIDSELGLVILPANFLCWFAQDSWVQLC